MRLRALLSASGFACSSLRLGFPVGLGFLGVLATRPLHHAPPPYERVASLAWLAGCWVEDLGPIRVVDVWTAPAGHAILGVSRTLRGDSTIARELRRVTDTTGTLVLTAVSADRQIALRADDVRPASAEFAGTVSGRPTVVRFTREGTHELELGTERRIGARQRTINELFERAPCGDERRYEEGGNVR